MALRALAGLSPLARKPWFGGSSQYLRDIFVDDHGDLIVWFMGRYERGSRTAAGDWLFKLPSATFRLRSINKEAFRACYAAARAQEAFRTCWRPIVRESA